MAADAAKASVDAYVAEVITWKFAGAAAWHAALLLGASTCWLAFAPPASGHLASLLVFGTWLRLLALYITCFGVLAVQRRLLAPMDVPPLRLPRLGLSSKSWLLLSVARCIVRQRRLGDVAVAAAFYAACLLSGAYALVSFTAVQQRAAGGQPRSWHELRWLVAYGAVLGWTYATMYLLRAMNVLSYPILQRQRYFRVRSRLRAMARAALVLPTIALAAMLILTAATAPWHGFLAALPPAPVLLRAWRAGVLAVFAWTAGAAMLEVVFTEHVAFADADAASPTLPLLLGLQHGDPVVQDWALMDLVAVAEGAPKGLRRRAALFADESGAGGWSPVVSYCLAEVEDLVGVLSAALPSLSRAAKAGSGGGKEGSPGGVRWNALQLSSTGAKALTAEQDLATWHLQARFYRVSWSMRALAGLARASLREDVYGVAQLSSPGLADVVMALLQAVGALQQHIKYTSSIPARPSRRLLQLGGIARALGAAPGPSSGLGLSAHHVDMAAAVQLDVARNALYSVTSTFGAVLCGVLKGAGPAKGPLAPAEARALLDSFVHVEE